MIKTYHREDCTSEALQRARCRIRAGWPLRVNDNREQSSESDPNASKP